MTATGNLSFPPQSLRGEAAFRLGAVPDAKGRRKGTRMSKEDLQLLKGTLDVMVLRALTEGPRHGYAVAEWIRETTEDTLQVDDGALYTALHRLEKRGYVQAEWGLSENNRKAKYYRLSVRGRDRLEEQTDAWARYARAVSRVLGIAPEGVAS